MSINQWEAGTLYLPGSVVGPRTLPTIVLGDIENPGFELGDANWAKGTGWAIDQVAALEGTWSAAYSGVATEAVIENNNYAETLAGKSTTLKAYCDRGSDPIDDAYCLLELKFYDSGFILLSTESGTSNTDGVDGEWMEISVTGTAPENAVWVRACAKAYATAGIVRVDNFSWDIVNSAASTGFIFKATQSAAGLSGESEPVWPAVAAGTVVDNEVTWEAVASATVTWEAHPIFVSGASEPTWPLINGSVVIDGTIAWETTRLSIDDPNCPNTREVAIGASKIFAGDYDITRFSATLNPRDWTTVEDAGFLPSGLHQVEQVGVTALGVYRGNLAIWSDSSFQVWQIDPDPTAMALLDSMEGIGSAHHKAIQPISNDLFFLAALGVRTVGVAAASTNLAAGDAGVPVDILIQQDLDGTVDPVSTYYPSAGQYWLAFPPYTRSWPGGTDNPDNTFPELPIGDPVGPFDEVYVLNKAPYSGTTDQIDYISVDYANDTAVSLASSIDYKNITEGSGFRQISSDSEFILVVSNPTGVGSDPVNFNVLELDGAGGFTELLDDTITRDNELPPLPDPDITEDVDYINEFFIGPDFFITKQVFSLYVPAAGNTDYSASVSTGTWSKTKVSNLLDNNTFAEWNSSLTGGLEDIVGPIIDFRNGTVPYSGYGKTFIAEFKVGPGTGVPRELRSFRHEGEYATGITFLGVSSNISTPVYNTVHNGWDRDSGAICIAQIQGTYVYYLQFFNLDISTGLFTDNGAVSIADQVNALAYYKGYIVTHQTGYGPFSPGIYSYSWDGTSLTQVDFIAPALFGTPSVASVDPYSDFIWFTSATNKGGTIEVLDDGTFGRVTVGYPLSLLTNAGTMDGTETGHMYFLPGPLGDIYNTTPALPPETALPYWDNLENGWIDITGATVQSFETTFGTTIESTDFDSVFAIGSTVSPIATLVNTLDGGNQISFTDDSSMGEAIMLLCYSNGIVKDYIHYTGVPNSNYITVPTGSNYYLVTHSDTGNAKVKKYDSTGGVVLTGSTPYLSVFGVDFLDGPSDDKTLIIPAAGIFIAFTVPVTALVYHGLFNTVGVTGISTTRSGALNQTVGDFTTPPTYIWGLGGGISYNINDPGHGDIDLVPGQTYILNLKNNSPTAANWIRTQHIWQLQ